jgi:hypothetical protein
MRPGSHCVSSESGRSFGLRAVALIAILLLSVTLATRTFHEIYLDHPCAQADPSHAMRQHLAADAFVLTSPVMNLGVTLLPVAAPHAPPAEVRVRTVELADSLYNRPPPFSLL